jgi:hypothetical protein
VFCGSQLAAVFLVASLFPGQALASQWNTDQELFKSFPVPPRRLIRIRAHV